jgi:hypothetical protein
MTPSRSSCTPLFLKAEPQKTGKRLPRGRLPDRLRISSSVNSSPPRYFSRARRRARPRPRRGPPGARRTSPSSSAGISSSWNSTRARPRRPGRLAWRDQVDDPAEALALHRSDTGPGGVRLQAVAHHLDDVVEVRADPVHLVHERDARDAVPVGLPPDRLGLRLHSGHRTEDRHRAVEHAERPLHLDGEVHVAGVSMMLIRYSMSLRFQNAVVAAEVIVMPRSCSCSIQSIVAAPSCTSPIRWSRPRVEQDALGGRGLPGIDVRHDADVPEVLERVLPGHLSIPCVPVVLIQPTLFLLRINLPAAFRLCGRKKRGVRKARAPCRDLPPGHQPARAPRSGRHPDSPLRRPARPNR